LTYSTWNKHVN